MEDSSQKSFQDKALEFAKTNWIILALFGGGLMFLGIGLIQILGIKETQIKFEKAHSINSGQDGEVKGVESKNPNTQKIKVDVEGEVLHPGVYNLNSDARVQDALIAAGGLSSNANRKAINLAARIIDGQKIYVPAEGETAASVSQGSMGSGGSAGQASTNGVISINSGSQSELESLPAVGPVTAQKIINARPYGTLEELVSKKAVGKATFEKIKDLISL